MSTPDYWGCRTLAGRRAWGPAVQLYSVRSWQSWGIGDSPIWRISRCGRRLRTVPAMLVNSACGYASRARAEANRTIALPADIATLRQPLYSPGEARDFVDRPSVAGCSERTSVQQHADQLDTIHRDSAWAAKRAAPSAPGAAVGGLQLALRRLPRAARAAPRRLRHSARWLRRTAMITR